MQNMEDSTVVHGQTSLIGPDQQNVSKCDKGEGGSKLV